MPGERSGLVMMKSHRNKQLKMNSLAQLFALQHHIPVICWITNSSFFLVLIAKGVASIKMRVRFWKELPF